MCGARMKLADTNKPCTAFFIATSLEFLLLGAVASGKTAVGNRHLCHFHYVKNDWGGCGLLTWQRFDHIDGGIGRSWTGRLLLGIAAIRTPPGVIALALRHADHPAVGKVQRQTAALG